MRNYDFLDERETQTRASALRRDERPEHALTIRRGNAGAVVVHGHSHAARLDPAIDDNLRNDRRIHTGFDGVPQDIAQRLPQQHIVPFNHGKFTTNDDVAAPRARFGPHFFCSPIGD